MERQLLLLGTEASYGTALALAAANTVWAEGVSYTPRGEVVRGDPAKPGHGQARGFAYGEHGELSFMVPLAASGVAGTPPKWSPIARACGWGETIVAPAVGPPVVNGSVTYKPLIDPLTANSLSVTFRHQRRRHRLVGVRGRMVPRFTEGQRPMLSVSLKGLFLPAEAAASPLPADADFTGWEDVPPVAQGRTTFSFAGVPSRLRELTFDQSDNVVFNDRPHQESVELLGARTLTGSLRMTIPDLAQVNLETLYQSDAVSTLSVVHGTAAGRIVTVTAKGQNRQPTYSEDAGADVVTAALDITGSTFTADDEIAIVLT